MISCNCIKTSFNKDFFACTLQETIRLKKSSQRMLHELNLFLKFSMCKKNLVTTRDEMVDFVMIFDFRYNKQSRTKSFLIPFE